MNDLALDVHSLAVHYGKFEALKSVNLSVHRGQIAGILGPNGAGKSTLVDAIVGAHRKAAGPAWASSCRVRGSLQASRSRTS